MLHAMCRYRKKAPLVGAFFICCLLFCAAAEAAPACQADRIDEWVTVARVYDGDTLRLTDRRVVRFIGINAPELAHNGRPLQALAMAAKDTLMQLAPPGTRLGLRYDQERHDSHHRLLAHLFDQQGRNLSAMLLRRGQAFAVAVAPNVWQTACYFRQEARAHKQGLGIWGLDVYRPKAAGHLTTYEPGFYRVRGRIDHIGRSRRNLWLDMGPHFAVRIPLKRLVYFRDIPFKSWLNQKITVRGWARFYNHKLNMTVTYPSMIENMP